MFEIFCEWVKMYISKYNPVSNNRNQSLSKAIYLNCLCSACIFIILKSFLKNYCLTLKKNKQSHLKHPKVLLLNNVVKQIRKK